MYSGHIHVLFAIGEFLYCFTVEYLRNMNQEGNSCLIHTFILCVGHIRLHRVTALEREEAKKKEKMEQRMASKRDDAEEVDRSTWAKYTLGLKHQVGDVASQSVFISIFE